MLNISNLSEYLPAPDPTIPNPVDQYVPVKKVRKKMRQEIDVLYGLYDSLSDGDVAVFSGRRRFVMTLTRVSRGLIMKIMDNHLFTLNHNDELLQFHAGQTAGFDPTLLKSRYAVSNLLRSKLDQLPKKGIDIHSAPNIIRMT